MNNKIVVHWLLLAELCMILFLLSCSHRETENRSFKGGFITKYGRYTTESGEHSIVVSENPRGILKYQVFNQEGHVLIDSNKSDIAIGVYQKWRLYWDTNTEYLWIDSSDRGIYVWIKQFDGSYTHDTFRVGEEPSFKDEIPEALKDRIRDKLKGTDISND